MNATGWTWETVRWELDIPRLDALSRYWQDMPPLQIELARIGSAFGVPRPEKSSGSKPTSATEGSTPATNSDADMMELFGMFPIS